MYLEDALEDLCDHISLQPRKEENCYTLTDSQKEKGGQSANNLLKIVFHEQRREVLWTVGYLLKRTTLGCEATAQEKATDALDMKTKPGDR